MIYIVVKTELTTVSSVYEVHVADNELSRLFSEEHDAISGASSKNKVAESVSRDVKFQTFKKNESAEQPKETS